MDFTEVFRQPKKSTDGCFTVLYRHNDYGQPRLGLAISRRCARSAVARNRVKRIIRESFRHQQSVLGSLDLIVMGKPGLSRRANAELLASLTQHWQTLTQQCVSSH